MVKIRLLVYERYRLVITVAVFFIQLKNSQVFGIRYNRWQYVTSLSPKIAPILGESALVDAETGQVYWQDTSRFRNTVEHAYWPDRTGVSRHLKSTFLSGILWLALTRFLLDLLFQQKTPTAACSHMQSRITTCSHMQSRISITPWIPQSWSRGFIHANKIAFSFLITFLLNGSQLIPRINQHIVVLVIILYLIEAYTCSTRIYLQNTLSSPDEVTEYMEQLRQQKPLVNWNVVCFHYENRPWMNIILFVPLFLSNLLRNNKSAITRSNNSNDIMRKFDNEKISDDVQKHPLYFPKVVETNRSSGTFQCSGYV